MVNGSWSGQSQIRSCHRLKPVSDSQVFQRLGFPNLMAPYDDRELSYVGYEFVLQKMEEVVQ